MTTKDGVIQDVRYEADSRGAVIHIDCTDGNHTITLPSDVVETQKLAKGVKVRVVLDADGRANRLELADGR